jgi:hypothetical protein
VTFEVGGRPGTIAGAPHDPNRQLRWQPVPGVWAQLRGSTATYDLPHLAGLVSFDHVLRCVTPFRLPTLKASVRLEACSSLFDPHGATGSATVHIGQSAVTVAVERSATLPDPTTTIDGHPAKVHESPGDGGAPILQVDIDEGGQLLDLVAEGKYDRATVLAIAAGCQLVQGDRPDGWPTPPLA